MQHLSHGVPLSNKPTAVTIGNFDGVHLGHQAMLERLTHAARERGLESWVLTFEPHPREFFTPEQAPARLTNLREKEELFSRFGVEHVHVCHFNQELASLSAEAFVQHFLVDALQAKWVLVGDDFRFGAKRLGDFGLLQHEGARHGFEAFAMPSVMVDGLRISSTAVREALAAGDLAMARRLLGRPYSISGRVVHGDKLGTEIGYPTANIQLKHNKPPLAGIFAVELCGLPGGNLPGVASLGVRPTVKQDGLPTLEVHVFDFKQQIYGSHVHVDFLHKLRDEEKFPSLDALIAAIAKDVADAKEYFLTALPR